MLLGLAATVVSRRAGHRGERPVTAARYQAPQSYYLALGDSIAYGFEPTKAGGSTVGARTGYVDVSPHACGSSLRTSRSSTTAVPASPP